MNILDRVIKEIKQKNMIKKNDNIVVGCSGGPDSIFLLEVLLKLKEEYDLVITLVHINHLYRGKDADRDENFVRNLGEKYNLQVFVKRKSMQDLSKKDKISLEEAGRNIRYSFFNEIIKKVNGNKIALAHNLDDQIETFLFRLIRGSSFEGLHGISQERENIIRPINNVYKSDLINYLDENKIIYMLDYTNFENDYTRNSIRLELIPFIEKKYNPKFKKKIKNFMEEIREINQILEPNYSLYIYNGFLNVDKLLSEKNNYIKRKVINYYLNMNNISTNREKINGILRILESGGTKKIKVNADYVLVKEYSKIFLKKEEKEEILEEQKIMIPNEVEYGDYIFTALISNGKNFKKDRNEFLTNLKKDDIVSIRSRKEGDKIIPIGMENYKKVKNIMIDKKIPKEERINLPIITYKDEIVWVAGITKSKKFVSENKENNIVLKIRRK